MKAFPWIEHFYHKSSRETKVSFVAPTEELFGRITQQVQGSCGLVSVNCFAAIYLASSAIDHFGFQADMSNGFGVVDVNCEHVPLGEALFKSRRFTPEYIVDIFGSCDGSLRFSVKNLKDIKEMTIFKIAGNFDLAGFFSKKIEEARSELRAEMPSAWKFPD